MWLLSKQPAHHDTADAIGKIGGSGKAK